MGKKLTNIIGRKLTIGNYDLEPLKPLAIMDKDLTTELISQIEIYKNLRYITAFDIDERPLKSININIKYEDGTELVKQEENKMQEVFEEVIEEIIDDSKKVLEQPKEEIQEETQPVPKKTTKKAKTKTKQEDK